MEEFEDDGAVEFFEPKEDVRAAHCRRVAANVLKKAGVTQPPVPVEELAQSAGLIVVRADLPRGVDALLRPNERQIEIASNQAQVRQRFSLAHELGHYHLGHAHNESQLAEAQANIFAGALLIPSLWLRRDLPKYRTPGALATRYQVSREAIFIALKDARLLNRL